MLSNVSSLHILSNIWYFIQIMHTRRENNQKCKEAFKEMAETGKDILIQERRGTKAVKTVTDDNEKRRNYRILIPYM